MFKSRATQKPRRKYRRRRRAYVRGKSVISRNPLQTGFPDSIKIKHEYVDLVQANSGATPYTGVWSLNGLYDPDVSGVGHQPYFYDEAALIYSRYIVWGCKVKIKAATSANVPMIVSMVAQPDTTAPATIDLHLERPLEKHRIIQSGSGTASMQAYFDLPKLFGVTKAAYLGEDGHVGTTTGNPASQYYLMVNAQAADISTQTTRLIVELTYYAKWKLRKRVAQS